MVNELKANEVNVMISGPGEMLPCYGSEEAAGADLRACVDGKFSMEAGERALVPTGLRIAIPKGYEGQVRPRSGLAVKKGLTVLNSPGTIDSDYRGEIKVPLINLGQETLHIHRGDRIAQLVIAPVTRACFVRKENLVSTERGEGGFGSTGVQ